MLYIIRISEPKFTFDVSIIGYCLLPSYILLERLDGCIDFAFFKKVLSLYRIIFLWLFDGIFNFGTTRRSSQSFQLASQNTSAGYIFLDAGLVAVNQSYDHLDYQICLQLNFSQNFFKGLVYEMRASLSDDIVRRFVAADGSVRDTHGIFEKLHRFQCCVDDRRESLLLDVYLGHVINVNKWSRM